jgi:flagellar export protein FliJ
VDAREKRIQRLKEIRTRDVQRAVAELSQALAVLATCEARVKETREALQRAEMERRSLSARATTAAEYIEFEAWLDTVSLQHLAARRAELQQKIRVERQRELLKQLRVKEKQVELLLERLLERRLRAEQRAERRRDDELARFAAQFKE